MSTTDVNAVPRTALFISHATPEDNHFVRWLGAKLSAMGFEVWADVMRLRGGSDWARELENALRKRSVKMLLVCTQSGLEKQGVRNEIEIAVNLARDLKDTDFIIPLRLERYDAPFRIAQSQYIDFMKGWAQGLAELADLLHEKSIPRSKSTGMETWLQAQTIGSSQLLQKSEPLMSNWLTVRKTPAEIYYCEPFVGTPLDNFQNRQCHAWPVVPHRGGVLTFARLSDTAVVEGPLPVKVGGAIATGKFLAEGWESLGVDPHQARKVYSDLAAQAFEKYCAGRGLQGYIGSGGRISWWGDIKTVPIGQVKFDWSFRRGARQIIGQSEKRHVHWHYAVNAQFRTVPFLHARIAARLVFSENGLDAIKDVRRAHTLRRSLAKGWRNPRWRDMLCAYLWWLSGGKAELNIPVAADTFIQIGVPPMQKSCPVTVDEGGDNIPDEDDPDIAVDDWDEDVSETESVESD